MPVCQISLQKKVGILVIADLIIALVYTVYRVANLSLLLQQIVRILEGGISPSKAEFRDASQESLIMMKYSTVFLITTTVIWMAVEIFLFFLLNNGARSKNYKHCKHWFIVRIFLLILSVLSSVIERVREQYTLVDGILEVEKLYRIITLYVVRSFMQEMYKGMTNCTYEYSNSAANSGCIDPNCPSINIRSRSHSHSNL